MVHNKVDAHGDRVLGGQAEFIGNARAHVSSRIRREIGGVERDANTHDVRIGEFGGSQINRKRIREAGQRAARQTTHMSAARLVAEHECIRLRAMQQAKRNTGVRRVIKRALPLDNVPAAIEAFGRELLH